MLELGRRLLQVKAKLPHGHFGLWVREKSGQTENSVQRYMKLAKKG
ncbi:DUF3102 domain-containing protein [Rhizobium herbae]|nr:DUF3102 domain-containing protein [Rhizobium herbae]